MNPNYYDKFISMFAGSPGHASAMSTNGHAPKVGIGIAQDPVTGHYFCVQHSLISRQSGGEEKHLLGWEDNPT